ncbi:MAG: hypothetical protein EKK64_00710 [Neisseriaceae bacterium]|nr:MAG: hypothetical protein EKK64_00710 [Neisseriaceae bacterium]
MYAICSVVCGYEIKGRAKRSLDQIDFIYDEIGIQKLYSGNGECPIFCGDIIYEFDETESIKAQELIARLTPTQEQIESAKQKMNFTRDSISRLNDIIAKHNLRASSQEQIDSLLKLLPEEPEVILIWSHS